MPDNCQELVKYRLETAKEKIAASEILFNAEIQLESAKEYCEAVETYLNSETENMI